jgi:hypothetical protein
MLYPEFARKRARTEARKDYGSRATREKSRGTKGRKALRICTYKNVPT